MLQRSLCIVLLVCVLVDEGICGRSWSKKHDGGRGRGKKRLLRDKDLKSNKAIDDKFKKKELPKTHEEWLKNADYSCIRRNSVVKPPSFNFTIPSTKWVFLDNRPRLYTVYRCKWGYQPKVPSMNLYCRKSRWLGKHPKCVQIEPGAEGYMPAAGKRYGLPGDDPRQAARSHDEWLQLADYTCLRRKPKGSIKPPEVANSRISLRHVILAGRPHLYADYKCASGYSLENKSHNMYCFRAGWIGEKPICISKGGDKKEGE